MRRTILLLFVAVVVPALIASASVFWAAASGAGREVGHLSTGLPVLIAVSASSVSALSVPALSVGAPSVSTLAASASSARHLSHVVAREVSESRDPVAPLWAIALTEVS